MSSTVVVTFQAKPDEVNTLRELITGLQDRVIKAGALTASLLQDQDDPARFVEVEVWLAEDKHKSFVKEATAAGAFEPLEAVLRVPFQVNYFDTVKFSRNRQR